MVAPVYGAAAPAGAGVSGPGYCWGDREEAGRLGPEGTGTVAIRQSGWGAEQGPGAARSCWGSV